MTPLAGPPSARSVRSSPGAPAQRSARRGRRGRAASPTSASSSTRRSASAPSRRSEPSEVVETPLGARDDEDPPRPERDRLVERELEIGRVLRLRVTDDPCARRLGRAERLARDRVEVADHDVDARARARPRARGRRPRRRRSRPSGTRDRGGPAPEATTTTSGSITHVPPLALPRSGSAGRRRGSRPLSPVARAPRFARPIVVERMGQSSRVTIRAERAGEERGVRALVERAFGDAVVGELVDALRASWGWTDGLSFVAERDGELVGHVLVHPVVARRAGLGSSRSSS